MDEELGAGPRHDLLERERRSEHEPRHRLLRGPMAGPLLVVASVLVLVAGAAWWKGVQGAEAERVTAIAERAAERAQALRDSDPALAVQVAVAAHELADTVRTRSALLGSTGPYVTRLRSSGDGVRRVAYSHDRAVLATGSDDGVIELWDGADPRRRTPIGRLPRAAGPVGALAFRPSGGDRVLLAAGTRGVELWNVVNPARPHRAAALPGATTAAFTPDGRTVLVAARGIRRWSLAGAPVELPPIRTSAPVTGIAVSADTIATAHDDGTVRLWSPDAPTGTIKPAGTIATGFPGGPATLAISPDGRALAYAAPARGTWLCRLRERRCGPPVRYVGPEEDVHALAFSPDGGTLATGGSGRRVRLWDVAARAGTTSFGHPGRVLGLAFTADGQALAVGSTGGAFYQWNRPTRAPDPATGVVLSRDRTLMATTGPRGGALWDVRDPWRRVLLSRWRTPPSDGLAVSGDGRRLATVEPGAAVTVWDVRDRREPRRRARLPVRGLASAALSEDGGTLATGDDGGRLLLWDVARPGQPRRLAGRTGFGAVAALDFSPDGRRLASGAADHSVRLWDVSRRTLDEVAHHTAHAEAVTGVRFGPKGDVLVSTGRDWLVRVWKIPGPRPTALAGHAGTVRTAAFSPDGRSLATTDAARTTRLWDLRTGRLLAELTHPDLRTALYADAHTLLSAAGRDVRLWDLRPGAVAARVCAAAGEPITRAEWRRYFGDLPYRPPCRETAAR